jgi:hypothetical protein
MVKTLVVNDSLHAQVKAAAAIRGDNIQEWVERALLDALDNTGWKWTNPRILVDHAPIYHTKEE